MKTLYMIGGPMGVGKTSVCRELQRRLDRSVFLDGDWCWDSHPFQVTEETCAMVTENICFLLNQFLRCSAYDHIIFCWVMHRQEILDTIASRLDTSGCRVCAVSLVCSDEALRRRLERDVRDGKRSQSVIKRSADYLPLYQALTTYKLDTTALTSAQAAERIIAGEGAP